MERLHQKQLQQLKQQQKVKEKQYHHILTHMINTQEQLKQAILFSKDTFQSILSQTLSQTQKPPFYLSDFTPASISKLVFQDHLVKIRQEFDKLPDSQAKLEHFVLIMMKVLFVDPSRAIKKEKEQEILKSVVKEQNLKNGLRTLSPAKKVSSPRKIKPPPSLIHQKDPKTSKHPPALQQKPQPPSLQFDKYPFYIIALNYMFKQIVLPSCSAITFPQLQKFIMGQVLTMSKPVSNTEFTIQFEQTKKQDFLLHDNGIRRLVYCPGLNVYLCLDVKQQMIKIYTSELKNKQNFIPNRQKHNRKLPEIVDMFYSDFGNTLGLAMADKSIQIVNFQAYMTKLYQKEFLPFAMHEIVVRFENPIRRIFFLQMFNRWLVIGVNNELMMVDVSKYRSKDQQIVITPVKNEKPQLDIVNILQIIPLSMVCVIAGNQIWFFDQKMSKKKYSTYIHQLNISLLKYYQEKNAFYLCGQKQKSLTILKPQRGRSSMEITTVAFSRPILDFEVFSMFGSIVLIDDKHTVRLVAEENKQLYQMQEYGRIVKDEMKNNSEDEDRKRISILKLNRQNFIIYESYMVSMNLAKVPIQTEIQFQFLPYSYFDPIKQDIHLSFNSQILCVSLLEGEMRESLTIDNSNLEPPSYFFAGNEKWKAFVLDLEGKIYDLSVRDMEGGAENESKKYKRKLQVKDVQSVTFDEELGRCLVVGGNQLYQVRNERQNTFSTLNVTTFSNFQVLSSTYVQSKKHLLLNCLSPSQPIDFSPRNNSLSARNSSTLNFNPALFKTFNSSQNSFTSPPPPPQQQFLLKLNISHPTQFKVMKFRFEKIKEEDKPEVVVRCLVIEEYDVGVVLTDENVVYLVDLGEREREKGSEVQQEKERKFICIKVYHFIAPKVRDLLKFNEIYTTSLKYYDPSSQKDSKYKNSSSTYTSLFLTSQQGFFIQINLKSILSKHFPKLLTFTQPPKNTTSTLSQLCEIDYYKLVDSQTEQIHLSKRQAYTFANQEEEFCLIKAHNACKIEIIRKIQLQFLLTLTVGRDGFVKLWNEARECIVSLKLPTLRREIFDIKKIQDIRGRRMMQQAHAIVKIIVANIDQKRHNLKEILHLTRHHELQKTYEQVNQDQPIRIDIENKSIQEIVTEEPNYHTIVDPLSMIKRFRHRYGALHGDEDKSKKLTGMQLKKQRSFENILEKSRLNQKNEVTIPVELLELRKPFKKYERKKASKSIDLPGMGQNSLGKQPKRQQLLILPKLKEYRMQSHHQTHRDPRTQLSSYMDADLSQYDTFQPCAFVKNKIARKKANQLDRIDKEFIRKEHSLLVKKHLAKKKDAVQIMSNVKSGEEVKELEESGEAGVSLETIVNDIRRIRYESKFGGDRFIPKVKFKSYSQLD